MTLRFPPVGLAVAAATLQALAPGSRLVTRPEGGAACAAAVVGFASTALLAGSLRTFRRARTTVNPLQPTADALVTDGPNRLTRNPMYVGMAGLLAAHAIARSSPAALVPAAMFVLAIDRLQIPAEEEALRERFGDAYERYAVATPQWLPGIC